MGRWPGVATIGIGVPGLYYPATGATKFLVNIPGAWDGFPVGETVAGALGLPTRLINDARAFGLAELRLGAGRGAETMVGFVMGTGIGGGGAPCGEKVAGHDRTAGGPGPPNNA